MHVLTKIFIVLVSLLSCMLVPLVVTYAYNENSYQARFQDATADAQTAKASLDSAEAQFDAARDALEAEKSEIEADVTRLRSELARVEGELSRAEAGRVSAESRQSEFEARLSTLASAVQLGQTMNESLITEVRQLRDDMLDSEQERIELDQAYQLALSEKEVAEKARRALEEELAQLKQERSSLLDTVSAYVGRFGAIDDGEGVRVGVLPDRDIETRVVEVRRSSDEVLAEIDAGQRDGVKVGWKMTISNENGFVANLRITQVDITRAVGVVELEQAAGAGRVAIGDRVIARRAR